MERRHSAANNATERDATDNLSAALSGATANATGLAGHAVSPAVAHDKALGEDRDQVTGTSLDQGVALRRSIYLGGRSCFRLFKARPTPTSAAAKTAANTNGRAAFTAGKATISKSRFHQGAFSVGLVMRQPSPVKHTQLALIVGRHLGNVG